MAPLAERLAPRFEAQAIDLPGHGPEPLHGSFDTSSFAGHLLGLLEEQQAGPVDCFGYSMGGYVALDAARRRPDLIRSVATLGTKFAWTPDVAGRECRLLDPVAIRAKVPWFADLLERRHLAIGWEEVLRHTGRMLTALGETPVHTTASLKEISQRVRIMVGDRDGTVTLEESAATARALSAGELEVLPSTPHPFEKVSMARVSAALEDFFLGAGA